MREFHGSEVVGQAPDQGALAGVRHGRTAPSPRAPHAPADRPAARLSQALLTPLRVRALRDGLSILGLIALVWTVLFAHPDDVRTYWSFHLAAPYGSHIGGANAFLYSPVAALVALPFHALPFEAVRLLLVAADVACLVFLAGPWALAVLALPPVFADVAAGNIHILLGTAIALGFRYPGTWAFVLLTKVTPGVGLLWFLVRREWRNLGLALGVTAGLALASALVVPGWWPAWMAALDASTHAVVTAPVLTTAPLVWRIAVSAALVAWGAWTGRRWTVPLAAMLALPAVWVMGTSILLGALPSLRAYQSTTGLGEPATVPRAPVPGVG